MITFNIKTNIGYIGQYQINARRFKELSKFDSDAITYDGDTGKKTHRVNGAKKYSDASDWSISDEAKLLLVQENAQAHVISLELEVEGNTDIRLTKYIKAVKNTSDFGSLPDLKQIISTIIIERTADEFADKAVNWVTGTPSKRKIQEWEEKYQDARKYLKGDTSVDVSDYQGEADDEGITLEEMLQTYKTKGDLYRKLLRKVGSMRKKMERKAKRDPTFNMDTFYWGKVKEFGLLFGYTE